MPTAKVDGRVIAVRDPAHREDLGVPLHHPPAIAPAFRFRQRFVLERGQPVRMLRVAVDLGSPRPIRELHEVRLAALAATESLVAQHRRGGREVSPSGNEIPLTLANIDAVAPTQTVLRLEAQGGGAYKCRLQRGLGFRDVGHPALVFGNRGDKPVPLVVTAQKTAFRAPVVDEQQQMPVGRLASRSFTSAACGMARTKSSSFARRRTSIEMASPSTSTASTPIRAKWRSMSVSLFMFSPPFLKRLGDCAGE